MSKLILLRHGETQKNTGGLLHKDKDPEELNEMGRQQIQATATHITKYKLDIVYSSSEKRALQSAKIISKILKLPVNTTEGFQERNWGDLSGKTWPEIKTILDPMKLEERYAYVPQNGESWKDAESRLIRSLNIILEENTGKNILIVTHGGAIRILMPYLLGAPIEETFKYDPDNASLTIFDILSDGTFKEEIINSTEHLPLRS